MTADETARLEAILAAKPDDPSARMRLLSLYMLEGQTQAERVKPLRRKHILWMVENRPADQLLRMQFGALDESGHALADKEGYALAAAAWKKHLAGDPPPAGVYANAIHFFRFSDPAYAHKLAADGLARHPQDPEIGTEAGEMLAWTIVGVRGLDRMSRPLPIDDALARSDAAQVARRELETTSNPEILARAGTILASQSARLTLRDRRDGAEALALAMRYVERAQKLAPSNPRVATALRSVYQSAAGAERDPAAKVALLVKAADIPGDDRNRFYMLAQLARALVDAGAMPKAAETASALLAEAPKYPDDWNYGNAIHWGNIVLGRVAVKDGKFDVAAKHLLAAGATKGSPQLNSFGPDWKLAKDLANHGDTAPVLEYIELCRKFWKLDRGALDHWASAIRAGGVPHFSPGEATAGGRASRDAAIADLVGKPAPELKLKDLGGKTVSLADFKGKAVLVDFWATWCAPCRKEMPTFEKLHREFAGKDVVVLTVDADEPEATPAQYMKDEKFTFPVLIAEGTDTVKRWGVAAFPTTIAVDAEGKVAGFAIGGRSETELRELIGKARK
jgi:thiol-disulfide isomerase/thioredoxin/tetratricopeptide (TPR) repeat protein